MSVVIEKCVAAYQRGEDGEHEYAAAITAQAYAMQKAIARTTKAVIIFMGVSGMACNADGERWPGLRR